jgi:hypothetical protein
MYRNAVVLIVSLLAAAIARAADDPKALIERARRATRDTNGLQTSPASYEHSRGILKNRAGGVVATVIARGYDQSGGRSRIEMEKDMAGTRYSLLAILNGKKGWLRPFGAAELTELSEQEMAKRRASVYHDEVVALRGLLEDKRFTLTALGESKALGKTVLGVKVSCKGQEDTFLYFDKATGLLARSHNRVRFPNSDELEQLDIFYLDYRALDTGAEQTAILKKAGREATGPALIAFLRKQTPPRAEREKAKKLVKKLGDDTFVVREQASKDLVGLGVAAVPSLEEASRSADAEVRRRAQTCLKRIRKRAGENVTIAAVHLLALRRPAGAAQALLDLLPTASAPVAREVRAALYHLGAGGGKPDPVLVAALKDRDPARRAAAAAALGKDGGVYARLPNRRIFRPGLLWPHKTLAHIGERRTVEWEVMEQRFYNRFDDSLFTPSTPNKP